MKKFLAIIVLGLLINTNLLAEEYSNSWKMDINCKQGNHEYYIASFVVSVENKKFSHVPDASTKILGTILALFFFSILIIDKIISDGIKSSSYLSLKPCRLRWPRGGMVTQRIANS